MLEALLKVLIKVLIFTLILFGIYYFFFLRQQAEAASKIKTLSQYHSNLVQNRLAYVALTRLDPDDPNVLDKKDNLFTKINQTQKEGDNFADQRIKDIYQRQTKIIEELKTKETFKEGLEVLKGPASVSLLVDQTNLILEFEYYLARLRELR